MRQSDSSQLSVEFSPSSLTMNPHRGRDSQVSKNPQTFNKTIKDYAMILHNRLRQSSAIFGKCSERSSGLWKIFGNPRKVVGNLRKIATKIVMHCEYPIYTVEPTVSDHLKCQA